MFFLPVGVISTEVTYVLGGLVFAWIVEEWVWDYAITVTLLHIAMTVAGKHTLTPSNKLGNFIKIQGWCLISAVMSDLPSAEHWWIALGKICIIICLFFFINPSFYYSLLQVQAW